MVQHSVQACNTAARGRPNKACCALRQYCSKVNFSHELPEQAVHLNQQSKLCSIITAPSSPWGGPNTILQAEPWQNLDMQQRFCPVNLGSSNNSSSNNKHSASLASTAASSLLLLLCLRLVLLLHMLWCLGFPLLPVRFLHCFLVLFASSLLCCFINRPTCC